MKDKIEINDSMPADLKAAINYLNENNISLSDRFDDSDEELDAMDDDGENIEVDDVDIDVDFGDTELLDESDFDDELEESELSDLDSMF